MNQFYKKLNVLIILTCFIHTNVFALTKNESIIPPELQKKLEEVYGKIKSDYVDNIDDKKLMEGAINGLVTNLDPHSSYLDIDAQKDFTAATSGEFSGVGIDTGMEDGLVRVVSPIEDSPAYKAGLKTGDLVFEIDGKNVKGMTLSEAINKIRGPKGTTVKLSVLRKKTAAPLFFSIVRETIKNPSIKFKLSNQDYPYLRITQFQENTGIDLAKNLKLISEQNKEPLKGLVIDLRNNPGGMVSSAVAVAAAFLEKDKLIVYSDGKTNNAKMKLFANPYNYVEGGEKNDYLKDISEEYKKIPIVVLVNNGSASAAEIVAGALQDHKRAIILGTQTFGKGTIQQLFPLKTGSAIKITIAKYYTPSGKSIQAKGILPNYIAEDPSDISDTPVAKTFESSYKNHLENEKESTLQETAAKIVKLSEQNKKIFSDKSSFETGTKADYQYVQAIHLLQGKALDIEK
ncbi:MAG: S41 family peptidase [Candidatus Methylopumilus sp.]|nr:S41 family peptidase [Candidatus Methylopumilus sp.]